MTDKINGRTPEEIKKGLECCTDICDEGCKGCVYNRPYNRRDKLCLVQLKVDALALNWQIEHERDELLQKNQQLERERDAAVEQLKEVDKEDLFSCSHCIHDELCNDGLTSCVDCDKDCPCHTCRNSSNWEWRGVPPKEEA